MKIKLYVTGPASFVTEVEDVDDTVRELNTHRAKAKLFKFIENDLPVYINPEHVVCVQQIVEAPIEAPVVDRPVID